MTMGRYMIDNFDFPVIFSRIKLMHCSKIMTRSKCPPRINIVWQNIDYSRRSGAFGMAVERD